MKLCDVEGFDSLDDLLIAEITDTVCPAICKTERCDHTAKIEPDQDQEYCEACGGNTVRISARARRPNLRGRPCKSETSTTARNAAVIGLMCGLHSVTMIVPTAGPDTCLRTKAGRG